MASLIIRESPMLNAYIKDHPKIKEGKQLTGNYKVLVVPDDSVLTVIEELGNTRVDSYSVVMGLMGKEALDAASITPVLNKPFLDLRGKGVLIGFVDTGIDYTNSAFKYENNTSKIQYIWDQTIEGQGPGQYGFGTEYSREEINRAIESPNPYDIVPHRDTVGHGTFLASVAGSREQGEYAGAAPDSELIVVKLRRAGQYYLDSFLISNDIENVYESIDVMQGVEYILEKAYSLDRPVAICISVGSNMGGHDGFNILEEYLSRISHLSGVILCCAAGNESDEGHHTSGIIGKTGEVKNIEINAGNDNSNIYVALWNNASDRISVSVTSPTGEMVGRIPPRNGTIATERLVFEKAAVTVMYFFPVEGSGSQLTVVKITEATPGIWTVIAYGDLIMNGTYDAWLHVTGLLSPELKFLAPVPEGTIVVPATAIGTITCGAFNSLNKSLYPSSSWGPTRLPVLAPDITAPGFEVTGIYPAGYGKMEGTSVSSAVTTGACALLLQWGIVDGNEPFMDTYLARSYIIRGCDREDGLRYPNNQWGYGRLNLETTLELFR